MLLKSLERFMWDGCQLSVEAFIWLVLLVSFSENLPAFSEEMHGPSVMHVAFSEYYIYIYICIARICTHAIYIPHMSHAVLYIWKATAGYALQELRVVEFFAGQGNVWRTCRASSAPSLGVDVTYHAPPDGQQNAFDILSSAGMGYPT